MINIWCFYVWKHPGNAQIRGNDPWASRGDVWNYHAQLADSTLEGQRPLKDNTLTLPRVFKKAGYKTGMIGKWGLGAPHTHSLPTTMGFDFFCGYNCQRQAHTYYPVHLYKNEKRMYIGNDTVAPGTKLSAGADPYNMNSYESYNLQAYSPDVMFREMTGFIENNHKDPFFFYWASPLPHMPLQAPQRWVDYYQNKFGEDEPYLGDKGYFPHRYPKAAYAAMISYLDENVGKLVQQLKELGIYENTLIIFTSDNGPTYNGGTDSPWFNSGGMFKSEYGWGKGFTHEGGLRVPMIASWPAQIEYNQTTDHISAFWDVLSTVCELTNQPVPKETDGISFLSTLLGKEQRAHDYLYWEFPSYGGQQAVRLGNWKGIRKDIFNGNNEIELYNLKIDLKEENDLSDYFPKVVTEIETIMKKEHTTSENERFRFTLLGD